MRTGIGVRPVNTTSAARTVDGGTRSRRAAHRHRDHSNTSQRARARAKTTKSTGASAHWDDVLPVRDDRNFRTGWAKGAASVRALRGAVPDCASGCASGDMGTGDVFAARSFFIAKGSVESTHKVYDQPLPREAQTRHTTIYFEW